MLVFDYRFYRSLGSPVAKRLYEILGIRFHRAIDSSSPWVHKQVCFVFNILASYGKNA